ncbi:hypothetical protein CATMQ487_18250 [Sphaerotilus microaerophilus]|uniref:Uncharacterized protein n=1 Tax=Sphaerotilus microaerophilus TaxID=2914710 RepID=A0ABN6PM19_9BURK|nr:hypothetical protein CATMQ487_18250 [Sphaerotilus sp. FB-5]
MLSPAVTLIDSKRSTSSGNGELSVMGGGMRRAGGVDSVQVDDRQAPPRWAATKVTFRAARG